MPSSTTLRNFSPLRPDVQLKIRTRWRFELNKQFARREKRALWNQKYKDLLLIRLFQTDSGLEEPFGTARETFYSMSAIEEPCNRGVFWVGNFLTPSWEPGCL